MQESCGVRGRQRCDDVLHGLLLALDIGAQHGVVERSERLVEFLSGRERRKRNVEQKNVLQNAVDGLLAVPGNAQTHSDELLRELEILGSLLGQSGSDKMTWNVCVYSFSSRLSSCSSRFL